MPLIASAQEQAGKRLPAVLRLWARAKAIPGEARLALNRLPTRCIRHCYLDRVLGPTDGLMVPAISDQSAALAILVSVNSNEVAGSIVLG